jgi:hypothetical protein
MNILIICFMDAKIRFIYYINRISFELDAKLYNTEKHRVAWSNSHATAKRFGVC